MKGYIAMTINNKKSSTTSKEGKTAMSKSNNATAKPTKATATAKPKATATATAKPKATTTATAKPKATTTAKPKATTTAKPKAKDIMIEIIDGKTKETEDIVSLSYLYKVNPNDGGNDDVIECLDQLKNGATEVNFYGFVGTHNILRVVKK